MKYLAIRVAIAILTFVIGVFVTAQVNRAAHRIWPDFDAESRLIMIIDSHQERKPCVRIFLENPEFRLQTKTTKTIQ
jgi:hypothetical protein